MATGTEAVIADALLTHLAELDTSPATDVAYPNVGFEPPTGAGGAILPYLRATILPAETISNGIPHDSSERHAGLMQIDVFWPAGQGLIQPLELANSIRDHFSRGLTLFSEGLRITVSRPASVGGSQEEPDRVMIPVTIPWRCHTRP